MNEHHDLEIRTPCPKTWDALEGGGTRRFCGECQLHVHDSTSLTPGEARRLVEEADERVCMRVVKDASGSTVYKDETARLTRLARWTLAAGAGLLAACRDQAPAPPEVDPVGGPAGGTPHALLGSVAPLEELGDVAYPIDTECGTEPQDVAAGAETIGKIAAGGAPDASVELLGEVAGPQENGGSESPDDTHDG